MIFSGILFLQKTILNSRNTSYSTIIIVLYRINLTYFISPSTIITIISYNTRIYGLTNSKRPVIKSVAIY